ncbi:Alpha/Beta hydrolase protein [Lanmaoa asiatica]|nr:Alpha/Beta hydrolase protein [Lanmaoa asiatica]
MAALCASTWGDPAATKHVLLIHGLTGSSQTWHRIAQELASRRYFVIAPDLLGHGNARRSSDYTVGALAEELRPFFTTAGGNDHPFHVVVGHSLGGLVASALFPLLKSAQTVQVVLVDPPLELTPELVAHFRKLFHDNLRNPKTPEAYLQESPLWTREDAIFRSLSERLCDVATVETIFDVRLFILLGTPDNVKVTVLAADPSKGACVREEDLKPYPHVTAKTVWGASHLIPVEFPQVIIETALECAESQN